MALPLGKLTLILGAGIIGSVLAQEGINANYSDYILIPVKFAWKTLRKTDSPPSSAKPRNDSLMAQVRDLQKQLQEISVNGPVMVYAGSRSGAKTFGIPALSVVVVGLGCMWWKGWKLSDLMFATKRGLADACSSVAKQLDQVTSSVSDARRHLSHRIDRVDVNLDECLDLTAGTRDEVSQLRGDMTVFSVDVESVHRAVQSLETKIGRIEEKQDFTTDGVRALCEFVQTMENGRTTASIQESPFSRPAIEHPQVATTSRTSSLPAKVLSLEPPSPSSTYASPKVRRPFQSTGSVSGLKVLEGLIDIDTTTASSEVINRAIPAEEANSSRSTSTSRFGWKLPSLNTNFLSRTSSAI